jgi:hypothetical protein
MSTNYLFAQKRAKQNIRRVIVTNRYTFENGKPTTNYWPVKQYLYDSLNRLHTIIEYDFKDHYPYNYQWNSFNGKQLYKTEIFVNKTMEKRIIFSYSKDSMLTSKEIYKVSPGDTSLQVILKYKYNSKKKPITITAFTPDRQLAYTSTSNYDDNGTELSRKVKLKKNILPADSIVKLTRKPLYDSMNRLVEETITITKPNNLVIKRIFKYKYDNKNNVIELIENDDAGGLIHREERVFNQKRNRLTEIKYYDSSNTLVNWEANRYEIYKTNNPQSREIEY